VQATARIVTEAARIVREKPEKVPQRLEKLLHQLKQHEKEIAQLKSRVLHRSIDKAKDEIITINNLKIISKIVDVDTPDAMRTLSDQLKEKIGSGIIVLGARAESKALLTVMVSKDLTDRFHAGKIIKQAAAAVGGGGGGRPDMAQAGGSQPEHLEKAIQEALDFIRLQTNDA
jgi:alanyl-tRNA synthetase